MFWISVARHLAAPNDEEMLLCPILHSFCHLAASVLSDLQESSGFHTTSFLLLYKFHPSFLLIFITPEHTAVRQSMNHKKSITRTGMLPKRKKAVVDLWKVRATYPTLGRKSSRLKTFYFYHEWCHLSCTGSLEVHACLCHVNAPLLICVRRDFVYRWTAPSRTRWSHNAALLVSSLCSMFLVFSFVYVKSANQIWNCFGSS